MNWIVVIGALQAVTGICMAIWSWCMAKEAEQWAQTVREAIEIVGAMASEDRSALDRYQPLNRRNNRGSSAHH